MTKLKQNEIYLGNPNVKKVGVPINFTPEQIKEYLKCKADPVYFAINYCKIVSLDEVLYLSSYMIFRKTWFAASIAIDLILQNYHDRQVSQPLL